MQRGFVLNLQRFTIHDGPGIRTLVFMKGCPLRCAWCSNPESQKGCAELGFLKTRCAGCGRCLAACPNGAIGLSQDGGMTTDRELCRVCGACAAACAYDAREVSGSWYTIEELLLEVEKDRPFYSDSGGGVTVGGGEPTQQRRFVREFLRQCRERWLHTALETCGHAPWQHLKGILEEVDVLFYDIKHMDPSVHQRITGVPNDLILENLQKVLSAQEKTEVVVRVPVIPRLNDSEENIRATASFVSRLGGVKGMELLPYHRLGISKYEQFGMHYELDTSTAEDPEKMQRLQEIVDSFGLTLA